MATQRRPHPHRITLHVTPEMFAALRSVERISTYTLQGFLRTAIVEQLRDLDNLLGLAVNSAEWQADLLPSVQQYIAKLAKEEDAWKNDPNYVPFEETASDWRNADADPQMRALAASLDNADTSP